MDEETVLRVARVARLKLTDDEVKMYSADLEDILSNFSILDEAPEVERFSFNPVDVEDKVREDEVFRDVDATTLRAEMRTHDDWVRGPRLS